MSYQKVNGDLNGYSAQWLGSNILPSFVMDPPEFIVASLVTDILKYQTFIELMGKGM